MDAELTLQEALAAVAQTTQLDFTMRMYEPPSPVDEAILRAGPAAVPALEELASTGAPTARVRAVLLLGQIAPARAEAQRRAMLDDPSPIVVNTCLVGYRRLSDWANAQRWSEPSEQRALERAAPSSAEASRYGAVLWVAVAIAALTTLALVFARCR